MTPDGNQRVDCAVVIVTYNSAADIIGLLNSLSAATDGLSLRVVVVDNGSTDGTLALTRNRDDVVCVEAADNLGYAGGINLGRKYAGDYSSLLVLNPDLIVEPDAIREMFSALDEPAVGMIVPMLLDSAGQRTPSLRRHPTLTRAIGEALLGDHLGWRPGFLSEIVRSNSEYTYRHPVEWATGAAALISSACDSIVGLWDEQFFLYSEEVDYAARVRSAGFRIDFLPTARVRHRGAGSGQSPALMALLAVNRVRYREKDGRRHLAYHAVVALHELLRMGSSSHRAALKAVVRRSRWLDLPGGAHNQLVDTATGHTNTLATHTQ
jgi:GT2 family glycosyltransferase